MAPAVLTHGKALGTHGWPAGARWRSPRGAAQVASVRVAPSRCPRGEGRARRCKGICCGLALSARDPRSEEPWLPAEGSDHPRPSSVTLPPAGSCPARFAPPGGDRGTPTPAVSRR